LLLDAAVESRALTVVGAGVAFGPAASHRREEEDRESSQEYLVRVHLRAYPLTRRRARAFCASRIVVGPGLARSLRALVPRFDHPAAVRKVGDVAPPPRAGRLRDAERIACAVAPLMTLFAKLAAPGVWFPRLVDQACVPALAEGAGEGDERPADSASAMSARISSSVT
jgi:hypothetical protein